MSDQHKAALAEGRVQGRAVNRYLQALEENRPRRGRKRTAESVKRRLTAVGSELKEATGSARLDLIQERRDLQNELAMMQTGGAGGMAALEKDFVKIARRYSERKGITYGAWREFGVPPEVLKKAGITRGA